MTQLSHFLEYIRRNPNTNLEEHKHPCVHYNVAYNHLDMEAAQCASVDEWIKQVCDIYTMEENFTLCDSMDGPGERYAK